jgi:hypothetical protein
VSDKNAAKNANSIAATSHWSDKSCWFSGELDYHGD